MTAAPQNEILLVEHADFPGEKLEVALRRGSRRRKRLAIRVTSEGCVEVLLPPRTPKYEVIRAIHSRIGWITHHVQIACSRPRSVPLRYCSGETLWYLGRPLELHIIDSAAEARTAQSARFIPRSERVVLSSDRTQLLVRLPSPEPDGIRKTIEGWYRSEADHIIAARLSDLCSSIPWLAGIPFWKLKTMKRRWGSCSSRGELTFNTRLIKASPRCIDYVLLHEIAHLRELNHSSAYYAVLASLMPDWKVVRQELQRNAALFLP